MARVYTILIYTTDLEVVVIRGTTKETSWRQKQLMECHILVNRLRTGNERMKLRKTQEERFELCCLVLKIFYKLKTNQWMQKLIREARRERHMCS